MTPVAGEEDRNISPGLPKGPFHTVFSTESDSVAFYYSVVNLLRIVIHYLKYSKSVHNVVIHYIFSSESLRVVNSLRIVNSLRVLFLVCRGPLVLRKKKDTPKSKDVALYIGPLKIHGKEGNPPPPNQANSLQDPSTSLNNQRIAKGAGGKGATSTNVPKCQKVSFDTFRQFSRRAKNVKNRRKVSKSFSTLFDDFRAAPFFRPLLQSAEIRRLGRFA